MASQETSGGGWFSKLLILLLLAVAVTLYLVALQGRALERADDAVAGREVHALDARVVGQLPQGPRRGAAQGAIAVLLGRSLRRCWCRR